VTYASLVCAYSIWNNKRIIGLKLGNNRYIFWEVWNRITGLDSGFKVHVHVVFLPVNYILLLQDVRCRYRYLSHLPLTCEFVLCELDLKPPILSQDTLKVFSDDLQKRKQKRIKKRREERRRERKCEPNSGKHSASLV
jgi:hypothetical protein